MAYIMRHPHESQQAWLKRLLETAQTTEWGRNYGFGDIRTPEAYAKRLPVQDYEQFKPYIERMMKGERDLLWPGRVQWFSKSSGTTSEKSKFIPVTSQNLRQCHIRGTWDTMTLFYQNRPDARQFEYKSMLVGGSVQPFPGYP